MICIFCLQSPNNHKPWCKENPGRGCTYGFACEYEGEETKPKSPPPQPKINKQMCVKCGLHQKNPLSSTNGCTHQYPA